jgi:uncharacterized membrane protein
MIHVLFRIGLLGKAVDGALEIISGVILLTVDPAQLGRAARELTQSELIEDPNDLLANFMLHLFQHLSTGTQAFAALFLLGHGLIKVGLVVALMRKLWWGFPTAIGAFGLFLAYQLYRYAHTRSVWLLAVSLLDVFVVIVTWLEYERLRNSQTFR